MRRILIYITFALSIPTMVRAQYNVDRLLLGGRIALHYEDYVLSIQYFNQAINQKPYLWEPWQLRAVAKYYLDDWYGACDDATQALALNPYITELYDLRGISYIRRGNYESAIADYTKAIRLEPGNWSYWYNRAVCYLQQKNYEAAGMQIDSIITKWKTKSEPYLMKAEICMHKKDTVAAEKCVEQSLEYDKYNAEAWRMKGMFAMKRELWNDADEHFTKTLHLKPKDIASYLNRALVRLKNNNIRGAMDDYNSALEFDPTNFLAHYNRGLLRQQIGDDNKAIEDFNFVLKIEPNNVMALFNRATLLDRTGNLQAAIRDYTKVINVFPNFWTGLHYRAACYRKLGMTAKAEMDEFRITKAQMDKHLGMQQRWGKRKLASMRKLGDIDPEKYDQIVMDDNVDASYEYQSAYRGKIQNRKTAIQLQPYIALTIHIATATQQITSNKIYDAAIINKMHELSLVPPLKGSKYELATLTCGNGAGIELLSLTDEITEMLNAREIADTSQLLLIRAITYYSAQDYNGAIDDFNRLLSNNSENFLALWMRAVCGAILADYENSKNNVTVQERKMRQTSVSMDFKAALKLKRSPILLYCYATFLANQGFNDEALELYTEILQTDSRMAYAYYNRAIVYMAIGNIDAAYNDLSKAGELGLYEAYSILKKITTQKTKDKSSK